ncbi:hypothetical protein B296_00024064 [Ensete ventricosum]|uniref:Uncharacterized protein n=1 Tax=Ensete ventricosum TaxID=4639 RepID=A0A426YX51_ENSVE|nr:hypothetical protein B296_00024064 [Ensete ventricosum]
MSWAASDLFDPDVGGSFANGDAVVAGLYAGVDHGHVARFLDVDAVGVGAVSRGADGRALYLDAAAAKDGDVEELAVKRGQAADQYLLGFGYCQ